MKQSLSLLAASVASGLVGGATVAAVSFVELQPSSPGTAQSGHLNVTGRALAGAMGVGVNPNTARIQVKETGTLQGVRSDTASGVAVYGSTSATTGTAPAGYFVNRSAGAAVVGDAQALTGSTIGGLFYNRAINGIGVSGRQLNIGGTGAAVQGTAASSGASGVRAVNTGNNSNVLVAGPARGVYVDGGTYTRNYGSGALSAVPIAYGIVNSSGSVGGGSGNFTSTRTGTGQYTVSIPGENVSYFFFPTTATPSAVVPGGTIVNNSTLSQMNFFTYDAAGTLADNWFTFVMYKTNPGALYPQTPDHGFKDDLEWARKRPREFERYMAACRRAEAAALEATAPPAQRP
jgi:hypothetical protein